jgi:hypothetical protein
MPGRNGATFRAPAVKNTSHSFAIARVMRSVSSRFMLYVMSGEPRMPGRTSPRDVSSIMRAFWEALRTHYRAWAKTDGHPSFEAGAATGVALQELNPVAIGKVLGVIS